MTNWEIANELYKAKKSYDSIWFIKEHELQIISPTKYLNEQLNIFFIQLSTVLDKCFNGTIHQLKQTDSIIEKLNMNEINIMHILMSNTIKIIHLKTYFH